MFVCFVSLISTFKMSFLLTGCLAFLTLKVILGSQHPCHFWFYSRYNIVISLLTLVVVVIVEQLLLLSRLKSLTGHLFLSVD